ncbi:helix-turn-helix transcriptional regulator [Oxalobacteraceae sp. CFBP 8763]|nr:helix-turn-helix transcriptional regulator [Oxalobacteraceae sp. CFBP 8763]
MKSIHDPRYLVFVEMLVQTRQQSNITQTELAQRLGKPQSYVAKIENLDRRIDIVELADWLVSLGTTPQSFSAQLSWWH